MLRNAVESGGVQISLKKRFEDVRFYVISVTRGWVGVESPENKLYVTLEWLEIGKMPKKISLETIVSPILTVDSSRVRNGFPFFSHHILGVGLPYDIHFISMEDPARECSHGNRRSWLRCDQMGA